MDLNASSVPEPLTINLALNGRFYDHFFSKTNIA